MTEPRQQPVLSEVLRSLPQQQGISFDALASALGSRAHGLALLILAIPDAVPLPLPSLSLILAPPMLAVSLHLAVHGEGGGLPRWLGRRHIPEAIIGLLKTRLAGVIAYVERLSQRRWQAIAGRERLIGLVCLMLALVLLLPLPFFNTPPAVCLALLAWGLIRRDGAFVLVGLIASAGVILLILGMAVWSWDMLTGLVGMSPLRLFG